MNGEYNQSFRQVMVSGVPTPLSSGTFRDLAPEQIGLFALSENGTISVAVGDEDRLQLAQGIQNYKAQGRAFGGGFSNAPRKTKDFSPSDISGFRGIKSSKKQQGQIFALGYDGVDASKTLTALLDVKDLRINVRFWGNMINKVTGNRNGIATQFYIDKGCLSSGCDVNSVVAGEQIADSLLKQMENSFLTNGYKFSDLVQARKIKKYSVAPGAIAGLVPFHKFQVSVTDDGSSAALGLVDAQYGVATVSRISRLGSTSVYEIVTKDTFTTVFAPTVPAALSLAARSVADCEVCPIGSTKVNGGKAYQLTGLSSLATPVVTGSLSVTLVGNSGLSKTFLVVMPTASVNATVIASGVALGYQTSFISSSRSICNFVPTTYTWVESGLITKAPATWKITLADSVCGTPRLSDLQANYPGSTIAADATGTCVTTYTISNFSENVEPECYPADYKYVQPSSFEGIEWVKFTTTLAVPNCDIVTTTSPCIAVGVIFETKIEDNPLVDVTNYMYAGYDQNRVDPVHIEIKVQSLDPNSNPCDEPTYPVTKLQSPLMPRGEGRFIMEREKESLGHELKRISTNNLINEAFGFVFNAKDGKFYDEYQLDIKHSWKQGHSSQSSQETYLVSVFFEEGQGRQFEALINGLIARNGLKIKQVYL